MPALALQDVVKVYPGGVRAVDGLSLELSEGELLALVGPSGCGKTTILRLIAGLEQPTAGRISIDGRPTRGVPPRDRDVAMVFQGQVLYPHLGVAGNMAFGLRLRRVDKAEIRRRVAEAAEMLGIADLLSRRPGELSGGQQQRVALGRAIVRNPRLFLFDEPLSNLDAGLRARMRHEIRRIHARLGTATVYVTHDQTEAMCLGRRIAVMRAGRIEQVADPATLYGQPANRFVAALIGCPAMNFLAGRIERGEGRLIFRAAAAGPADDEAAFSLPIPEVWTIRLEPYAGGPVTLGIRPEHIGSPAAEARPDAARLTAQVEAVEQLGPEAHVYLIAGSQALVMRADAGGTFSVGTQVRPAVATENLHFFDPQTQRRVQ